MDVLRRTTSVLCIHYAVCQRNGNAWLVITGIVSLLQSYLRYHTCHCIMGIHMWHILRLHNSPGTHIGVSRHVSWYWSSIILYLVGVDLVEGAGREEGCHCSKDRFSLKHLGYTHACYSLLRGWRWTTMLLQRMSHDRMRAQATKNPDERTKHVTTIYYLQSRYSAV